MKLDNGVPISAQDALDLWDSGELVPAIRVESETRSQDEIYALAFEFLREASTFDAFERIGREQGFLARETAAAHSIAAVAKQKGWANMLHQHDHPSIKAITVRKPEAPPKAA